MIEERPADATPHRHGHLDVPQPIADREHIRFRLGIVMRIVGREEHDASAVDPRKPDVGSVIRCRTITVTTDDRNRIPSRRTNGARYRPAPRNLLPTTMSARQPQ